MDNENLIYLEIVKDTNGQLRLADRKTGKFVAFQTESEINVQVKENAEDLQSVNFSVLTDDRLITEDIKEYLKSANNS